MFSVYFRVLVQSPVSGVRVLTASKDERGKTTGSVQLSQTQISLWVL